MRTRARRAPRAARSAHRRLGTRIRKETRCAGDLLFLARVSVFRLPDSRNPLVHSARARAHLDAHARTARRVFTVGFGVPPSALFRLDDFAV